MQFDILKVLTIHGKKQVKQGVATVKSLTLFSDLDIGVKLMEGYYYFI